MSNPNVQECAYLKVDHDFEYKTNDGRQIVIKKDEKLCLIQKTNKDWWKVIRNQEQRSFYVPVTYVRELGSDILPEGKLGGNRDDEQILEETTKDRSARRKHVEKWLSNTVDITHGAAGGPENLEGYNRLENVEDVRLKEIRNRIEEQKLNLQQVEKNNDTGRVKSEKKSLERFRNAVRKLSSGKHALEDPSLRGTSIRNSQTGVDLQASTENAGSKLIPASNCRVYSPKKIEELGRNLFDYQTPPQHQVPHGITHNQKEPMRRSNSTDSAGSNNDRRSANSDTPSMKSDAKVGFNEELNQSPQKNSAIKRYSNSITSSVDRRLAKPNIERRPSSPISAGKKTPTSSVSPSPQSIGPLDYSDNAMKILNDKRKSWAIEELMSELTQIRKERVDDNTSNFVLRSVEISDRFDPLEKLTQELHDLHTPQCEGSAPLRLELKNKEDVDTRKAVEELSPSKVKEHAGIFSKSLKNIPQTQQHQAPPVAEFLSDKTKSPKTRTLSANNEAFLIQANLNTSKSPKRQDEYEEANILNDESRIRVDARAEGSDRRVSLSADKEHYLSAYQEHSQLFETDIGNFNNFEKPSYSNISIKSENEVKIRPELKLKIKSVDTKIKLTPSLEKLANEIQFLPASRTSVIDNDKQHCPLTKNYSPPNVHRDENHSSASKESLYNNADLINVSQDREMWKNFKSKLNYKSSFKSKQGVTKDVNLEEDHLQDVASPTKTKLKKSATFHCVAVPEYYKHFQRHRNSPGASLRKAKWKSRSLEDVRVLVNMELKFALAASGRSEAMKNVSANVKPVLSIGKLPPKPIPAQRTFESARDAQVKVNDGLPGSFQGTKPYLQILPPSVSKSYENLSQEFTNLKVFDANKSTAVSFKNLLCTSDSGSDEYLHYKAFPKSSVSRDERSAFTSESKIKNTSIVSSESLPVIDRSISDEQILSSNISSEALFSQSESEVYALSELSNNSSPVTIARDRDNFVNLPPGWTQEYDAKSKQICFVNVRGEKWFSSNDEEGKIYFFEENSNESSWLLPSVSIVEPTLRNMQDKHQDVELRSSAGSDKFRMGKARSLVVGNQRATKKELAARRSGLASHDWPQLFDGNMCILKEGTLQRTKITENGKRLRKNWSTSYVVLSELFLLFFKDAKSFSAMKSGQSVAKPDISVDLNGATIQPGEKASSRKNVYMIGTILGLQVLIQSDNTTVANEWYQEIHDVISRLPSSVEGQTTLSPSSTERPRDAKSKLLLTVNSLEENKPVSKIGRSRSIKLKKIDGSTEDLSGSSAERQTKIKAKLKRFFQRRPTMDALVKNGIYKDEPAFGSYLKDVCSREPPMVPQFVKDCIKILERSPENMKADGLYRASGNLSQIQKIRLQVDQNNLDILEQEEDVHVLTGALKLFFRELKEPLIPYEFFEKALKGSMSKKKSERIQIFREIVRGLTQPHYDTLQFLLQHLLRVTMYQEYNRMHIPNLAIVFGPTLMWPAVESANMALDLMQQNLVIECLLSEYDKIFK